MATGIKGSTLNKTLVVTEEDYLLLIRNGSNAIIQAKALVPTNITETYVELLGDDNTSYRLNIVNGKAKVVDSKAYTSTPAKEGDNGLYDGLIINQMYGGGNAIVDTPITHSFIELYNNRGEELNLNGLYLWYRSKSTNWTSLKLEGIIPAYHSFLIRCGQHVDVNNENVIYAIRDYDQSWDIKLSDQGFSVYLCIGDTTPEDNPVRQVVDPNSGTVTSINGRYIDLLGAGGEKPEQTIFAYEKYYWNCMNNHTGVHRIDFANSGKYVIGSNKKNIGNNQGDVEPLDYNKVDLRVYRPRSLNDGAWRVYYDKTQFSQSCPSAINIGYGEEGTKVRTFAFQTPVTKDGYVRFKEQGASIWEITVDTTREVIKQGNVQVTLHRAIVELPRANKTYEYQCGYDGCWSDISTIETKEFTNDKDIHVLWTSDQQGWGYGEYGAWETSIKYILNHDDFKDVDFHLNTGDISQNANRYFEWLDYYKYTQRFTKNMCHMFCCGNNDLINKKYSDAWAYYITTENPWANSVHSFDLGYTHWICLNSNTDYTYVNGDGSVGGYGSTDAFIEAQCQWLDAHLAEVNSRPTPPRWVICYMHLSPFTCVRTKRVQPFIEVMEKFKVNLVLCGHNHLYTRSIPIYSGYTTGQSYNDYYNFTKKKVTTYVDEKTLPNKHTGANGINHTRDDVNGTIYIQCPATGFKTSGKETIISTYPSGIDVSYDKNTTNDAPWWQEKGYVTTQPAFIDLKITYNSITSICYAINGTLTMDGNKNITVNPYGTQNLYEIDRVVINK